MGSIGSIGGWVWFISKAKEKQWFSNEKSEKGAIVHA